jgi:threonine dehydrogenase-like Zn-dependent dehydrogenase
MTMRQLTFMEPGKLAWQEVPTAALQGDGEAIVRPVAVANCDLDGLMFKGLVPVAAPFAVGHEFIAEVVDVGSAVTAARPGDRVIVPFQVSCGECDRCRRGLTSSCQSVKRGSAYGLGSLGGTEWGGALSDLVRVPYADAMLVPLPAAIDPVAWASASDNIPDGYRTVGPPLEKWPGAPGLIVSSGFGSIPLYAAAMAVALGAERVDFIDPKPERLELVARLGANPIEGPPPRKAASRYPVTVDASASAEGLGCALRSTEAGGTCTSIGIYYADTAVPLLEMYTIGVTLTTGRVDARHHLPAVLALYERGFNPGLVLSATAPWADAAEAFVDPPTKLVITRD